MPPVPKLTRIERDGVAYHTDERLLERSGIAIAFSERSGGVSEPPYASLNLAAHTGDDPAAVNVNRARFLDALGIGGIAERLTTAEQVHGSRAVEITPDLIGSGAQAGECPPVPGADALFTCEADTPLMLFFADCVPVILVSESARAIAVVHAGWKGALAGIAGAAARQLSSAVGEPGDLVAYVGPHIRECCYETGPEIVSQFANMFVTIPRASGRLDLAAAVAEDLVRAGVPEERQCHLGNCTAHNTDRFYSYRAEGRTGRHAALAAITSFSRF
ncbi:MAG: polyphenol oxidase family protein [Coriobacteriia bacterium]